MLLSPLHHVCLRRLDIRGTHAPRHSVEQFIYRTHKHKWSQAWGDKEVYAPDDIRHDPKPVMNATLAGMDEKYDRVVRVFVAECRMIVGGGDVWVPPQLPATQEAFDGMEDYP
ncbi:hypothetical protein ACL02R_25525 [Streptomyces sp. MS19]|uniref:hypothetical protein n=1 Tax=Streptomyces sp. MS19 TaxID=3385972 RepID=UPI00399F1964